MALDITLRAESQLGLGQGTVGSGVMKGSLVWKRIMVASITLMIKCGGFPNFLTVAMLAGLIVFKASFEVEKSNSSYSGLTKVENAT